MPGRPQSPRPRLNSVGSRPRLNSTSQGYTQPQLDELYRPLPEHPHPGYSHGLSGRHILEVAMFSRDQIREMFNIARALKRFKNKGHILEVNRWWDLLRKWNNSQVAGCGFGTLESVFSHHCLIIFFSIKQLNIRIALFLKPLKKNKWGFIWRKNKMKKIMEFLQHNFIKIQLHVSRTKWWLLCSMKLAHALAVVSTLPCKD